MKKIELTVVHEDFASIANTVAKSGVDRITAVNFEVSNNHNGEEIDMARVEMYITDKQSESIVPELIKSCQERLSSAHIEVLSLDESISIKAGKKKSDIDGLNKNLIRGLKDVTQKREVM